VAHAFLGHVPQVLTVDFNRAAGDIVEPEQQTRDGRLASAGGADDGNRLAGGHLEINTLEDRAIRIVVKLHILEGDFAANRIQWLRTVLVLDFGRNQQQIEHGFDIGKALPDFSVQEPDKIERNGDLHQQRVDQDKVTDILFT